MPEAKTTAVSNSSQMVKNSKIDWNSVKTESQKMKQVLVSLHEAINGIWAKEKCRELATIESAVRNSVEYLDKLPDSIDRYSSKAKGGKAIKGNSVLAKPR